MVLYSLLQSQTAPQLRLKKRDDTKIRLASAQRQSSLFETTVDELEPKTLENGSYTRLE
jgi:hypothetical protein